MINFLQQNNWVLLLLALWTIPWKGVAMWKASRLNQRNWFIALLIVNTLGLLEIFYIFYIARKPAQGWSAVRLSSPSKSSGGKEKTAISAQ